MKRFLIIVTLLLTTQFAISQNEIWQTAVYATGSWSYIPGSADVPNDWREVSFNDNDWNTGIGSIGYGDGDDGTVINNVFSLYMRKSFAIIDKDKILGGLFNADFDDAFVAYLNGVEIARYNIEGDFPDWDDDTIIEHEAEIYNGGEAINYFIDEDLLSDILLEGENVLAVQTHNKNGLSSSDMTSLYWLSFFASEPLAELGEFHLNEFQSGTKTPLPVVKINTFGIEILNEPKIDGEIGIVWNADGSLNDFTASANEYSGNIRIEKRGQSSQSIFPKFSYLFETVDDDGNDVDASFLNFPEEEDFILHGPYSDKSLLRNVLIFDVATKMDQYASRTRFVELQINGIYEGIYVLMERIKRDEQRVDIAKLREEDTIGDELTGGYIFKIDKDQPDWYSQFDIQNNPGAKLHFQYVYPRRDDIMPQQETYIQSYVDSFERAVRTISNPPDAKSYEDFIDLNSFVDHFLLVEFAKDVDAYRFSSYFHKDKDSNGGKLKCGPLWDFNLSFGNADYCSGWDPNGFMYNVHCGEGNPFWWDRMFTDPNFRNHAQCRWQELRQTVLHQDNLFQFIDDQASLLDPALDRNFEKWPILEEWVWPNSMVPGSYEGEITFLKNFITQRLAWMDNNMLGICDSTMVITPNESFNYRISPNPARNVLNLVFDFRIEGEFEFIIYDELGRQIPKINQVYNERNIEIDISQLPQGIYFLKLGTDDKSEGVKKFVIAH